MIEQPVDGRVTALTGVDQAVLISFALPDSQNIAPLLQGYVLFKLLITAAAWFPFELNSLQSLRQNPNTIFVGLPPNKLSTRLRKCEIADCDAPFPVPLSPFVMPS